MDKNRSFFRQNPDVIPAEMPTFFRKCTGIFDGLQVFSCSKGLIFIFLLSMFGARAGQACICMGMGLEYCLKNDDAIFIGVLTGIVRMDSLYMADEGSTDGRVAYFNFKVIKYYKGLEENSDYVSVFDHRPNCGGYCNGIRLGDTMLLFASIIGNPYEGKFLVGSQCHRYAKLSVEIPPPDSFWEAARNRPDPNDYYQEFSGLVPNEEEVQFLQDSTVIWKTPYIKEKRAPEQKPPPKPLLPQNWPLLASLLLNFLLAVLLWRRGER